MTTLFELKLQKDWVNAGDFSFIAKKNPRVYVETFGEKYIKITINMEVEVSGEYETSRDDTEIKVEDGNFIETETLITIEDIGKDALENLFTQIHEIMHSIDYNTPNEGNNPEQKDYE